MSGISTKDTLRAPFPWYGGKRRVAAEVWAMLGKVDRYVEPFAGSLGVLFGRPAPWRGVEVVNDIDGFVVNAWRAIKHAPRETAEAAIDTIFEIDLMARNLWLVNEGMSGLVRNMRADNNYYDIKTAAWWLQGVSCWVGTGYCQETQAWTRERLVDSVGSDGRGVNRQLPHLGGDGQGDKVGAAISYFQALAKRLENCIITQGDWSRVITPSATGQRQLTCGIFIDPPYRNFGDEYAAGAGDVENIWLGIEAWAPLVEPPTRVIICGYAGDFTAPDGWREISYTAKGTSSGNADKERFWVSPACIDTSASLF